MTTLRIPYKNCSECFDNITNHQHQDDDILESFVQRRRFERSVGQIVAPAFITMNFLSLVANVLILFVLFRRGIRSRSAEMFVTLGFNNILFLCVGTPWKLMSFLTDSWPMGSTMCKVAVYSLMLTLHIEVYTLLLLAALRYMAISSPLRAAVLLTNVKMYILMGTVWISAILVNIPGAMFATLVPFTYKNRTDLLCMRIPTRNISLDEQIYGKCHFVLTYIVPLLIIFTLLGASIKKLNTAKSCIIGETMNNRKKKRAVCRLVALTTTYAVCVFPITVLFILRFVTGVDNMHSKAFVIMEICALFFAFVKCSIHPLLYNCMAKEFRQDAIKLIMRQIGHNGSTSDCTTNLDSAGRSMKRGRE